MALSKGAVRLIGQHVDKVFDTLKARLLGPGYVSARGDKKIFITAKYRPEFSLPGIYRQAASEEAVRPNEATVASLASVAESYIDAQREVTRARVLRAVNNWIATSDKDVNIETVLGGELADVWTKVTSAVVEIANSEATTARNMGTLEGIVKMSAMSGVEDPHVAFIGPNDSNTCEECRRVLYVDGVTPRVFRLSEVSHEYHKRGTDTPCISGMHPSCRHTLVAISPGFGFDERGKIKYRGPDHSELETQRAAQ